MNFRVLRRALSGIDAYIRDRWFCDEWFIAWRLRTSPADANDVFREFRLLRPPRDRYWADPFPVHVGNS